MEYQNLALPDLSQAVVLSQELDKNELWRKQREDKFTSSNVSKLMTYEDKIEELPKGAITYIEEVAAAILTDGESIEDFRNEDMERGNEKELEAILRFEQEMSLTCYATGENQEFVELCSYFGGTPDGLFNEDGLVEIKCPKSKTHLSYLRNIKNVQNLKKHKPNYYWQIQGNLLATGRQNGFFISYDERFKQKDHQILIIKVLRNDEDIVKLEKRLQLAESYKKELLTT
ncbi:lambda exonuclease family protein [Chryseobacterium potabilaquae]|uniref:YqaJ viral recombinase domain-containing protein n=1 Tax=Chryseobacterium potabilaquae TaxID=2675057 RepID=A0A6N4XBC0_9FLAO|nr:lambda exonuclease family protein [Chryseobacterium potabilaquae]CAA7196717.1 hypothetical protein CHRY9293_02792 [Chryseobacterium potabilaquae]